MMIKVTVGENLLFLPLQNILAVRIEGEKLHFHLVNGRVITVPLGEERPKEWVIEMLMAWGVALDLDAPGVVQEVYGGLEAGKGEQEQEQETEGVLEEVQNDEGLVSLSDEVLEQALPLLGIEPPPETEEEVH